MNLVIFGAVSSVQGTRKVFGGLQVSISTIKNDYCFSQLTNISWPLTFVPGLLSSHLRAIFLGITCSITPPSLFWGI